MKSFAKKLGLTVVFIALSALVFSSTASAQNGSALDQELAEYWTTERDLDVIKGRLFDREGRISAGFFTGLHSSDPFFFYLPVGLRAGYHFSDSLGVEVGGAFMDAGFLTQDTELTEFMRNRLQDAFDDAAFVDDRYLWRANAVATWSPFYGKLALLQRKLAHFDLNFAAGLGAVGVSRPAPNRLSADTKVEVEMVLGTGAHFYLNNDVLIRLDGRGYLYRGPEFIGYSESFVDRLKFPVEFLIGATYLF